VTPAEKTIARLVSACSARFTELWATSTCSLEDFEVEQSVADILIDLGADVRHLRLGLPQAASASNIAMDLAAGEDRNIQCAHDRVRSKHVAGTAPIRQNSRTHPRWDTVRSGGVSLQLRGGQTIPRRFVIRPQGIGSLQAGFKIGTGKVVRSFVGQFKFLGGREANHARQ